MRKSLKPLSLAALVAASAVALSGCAGGGGGASTGSSSPASSAASSSNAASAPSGSGSTPASGAPGSVSANNAAPSAPSAAAPAWSSVAPAITSKLKAAKSLTVTGGSGKGDQKMDMSAKGAVNKTGDFEIVMKQTEMNVDFRMIRVGGTAYMKGNEAAYTEMMGDESGTTAKLVGDKYLLLSDEMLRSFGESLNLASLRDELVKITPKASTKMSATVGEYEGSPAYVYADSKVTVYVATDGSNRPLAYQDTSGTQSYVISEWDKDYSLATPDPDKVISMEELQKQAQQ